jgi:hypothetical protein
MFRDMDMAVHEGVADAYEGARAQLSLVPGRQGRDEYDEPPSCTAVVGPIAVRDVCDYFEKLA